MTKQEFVKGAGRLVVELVDRSGEDLVSQINRFAETEGWAIFNGTEIQRDDEAGTFEFDDDAVAFVQKLADAGSALHAAALDICTSESSAPAETTTCVSPAYERRARHISTPYHPDDRTVATILETRFMSKNTSATAEPAAKKMVVEIEITGPGAAGRDLRWVWSLLNWNTDDVSAAVRELPTAGDQTELAQAARAVLAVLDSRPVDGEIVSGNLNCAGVLRAALDKL